MSDAAYWTTSCNSDPASPHVRQSKINEILDVLKWVKEKYGVWQWVKKLSIEAGLLHNQRPQSSPNPGKIKGSRQPRIQGNCLDGHSIFSIVVKDEHSWLTWPGRATNIFAMLPLSINRSPKNSPRIAWTGRGGWFGTWVFARSRSN